MRSSLLIVGLLMGFSLQAEVTADALHNVTGLTDQPIESTLSSYGLNDLNPSSIQISNLLASNCL